MIPRTVARQARLSMGFPRQEYWSGLPFPSPGDLPDPEIKLGSPALAGGFFTTEPPGKPVQCQYSTHNTSIGQKKRKKSGKVSEYNPCSMSEEVTVVMNIKFQ